MDVLRGVYVLGLDPSPKELAPVLAELEEQNISSVNDRFTSNHRVNTALDALLSDSSISLDEARDLFDYFATNNTCRRDGDQFQYLSKREYFWKRTAALLLPFAAITTTHRFIPNFTPGEREVFEVVKTVVGGFAALQSVIYVAIVLLEIHGTGEDNYRLLFHFTINMAMIWGAQAGREAS
jgi:hypothetical protein